MAIRNPHELRIRLRQNVFICGELAEKQLPPERRAILLRIAERYRVLADKMDEPKQRWEAVLKSYGLSLSEESEPAGREHTSAILGPSPPGGNFT
jgi:hypothetical protein